MCWEFCREGAAIRPKSPAAPNSFELVALAAVQRRSAAPQWDLARFECRTAPKKSRLSLSPALVSGQNCRRRAISADPRRQTLQTGDAHPAAIGGERRPSKTRSCLVDCRRHLRSDPPHAARCVVIDRATTDWQTVVEQHGPDVWRTAYRLLSNREDASDAYQETFLQAVEFARRQPVACWPAVLKRIVTARSLDILRRRYRSAAHREPLATVGEPAARAPAPDTLAELREGMEALRQALGELPDMQAQVFWLSEVEMLSHADIAHQLDGTVEQVAVWLHRAKRKLRSLLAARGVMSAARSPAN
jgi:RNA polymerase sigma factor (sigma-70 family)